MDERAIRAALERHWDASDGKDSVLEHELYHDDAVLDYPQTNERIRGRDNIKNSRSPQSSTERFVVEQRRIIGSRDLWVTEFILSFRGIRSYAVCIMEFSDGLVTNETQYFAETGRPIDVACN